MSELLIGLLAWLGVAVVAGVVIGRFMRMPEAIEAPDVAREKTGLYLLPGYGWEEAERDPPTTLQSTAHLEQDRSFSN